MSDDSVPSGAGESAAPYDSANIEAAIARFRDGDLNMAESLLASVRLAVEELARFRKSVARFRSEHGDAASREFATVELNDLIYDLQDAIPPTVRAYNALLRDLEQGMGPPE